MQPMVYGGPMHAQLDSAGTAGANLGYAQPMPMTQYLDMDGMLPDYLFANDMMWTWSGGQQARFQ